MDVSNESTKKASLLTVSFDDFFSDMSENSSEEEPTDPVDTNTLQSISNEFANDDTTKPFFNTIKSSKSKSDDAEDELNLSSERNRKDSISSTSSDSDKDTVILRYDIEKTVQTQQFDADSPEENKSTANAFYIPDEIEIEEQNSNTFVQYLESDTKPIKSSNKKQPQNKMALGEPYIHSSNVYGFIY